jgi:hypothetical protein
MQNIIQEPPVRPADERPPEQPPISRQARTSIVGIAFIVAGLATLVAVVTQSVLLGVLIVPLLGVLFLAVAFVTGRYVPFFIPGCIMTGLGIGLLVSQEWLSGAAGTIQGSLPVIGLALGFLAITPLCWYIARVWMVWPLFPGTILLIIGVGVLFGGPIWSEIAGPLVLVAVGGYLLLWRAGHPSTRTLRERRAARHHSWDTDRR